MVKICKKLKEYKVFSYIIHKRLCKYELNIIKL